MELNRSLNFISVFDAVGKCYKTSLSLVLAPKLSYVDLLPQH